jgi:hypothetical protein
VTPVLDIEISHGSSFIVVTNCHCSLIGLVIDCFSSEVPLSLLSKSFKNMLWADLHDGNLLISALLNSILWRAFLELPNFSIATSWDLRWLKCHEFGLLHVGVAETTILVTEGLVLSVWVPVIMSLIISVILIEGVVQVTIDPWELRNMTKVEGHLGVFTWLVVVSSSNWVELLHEVRVDNLVSEVVMGLTLMPEVIWRVGVVEVLQRHFTYIYYKTIKNTNTNWKII